MMKYNKYIDFYLNQIKSGEVKSNEDIKAMVEWVEYKLSDEDVFIDHEKIQKAIEKIEEYFYKLIPWQKFIIALVHCYYKSDDTLVFDTFFLYEGRGSGKNGFISPLSWYFQTSFHGIKEYNIDLVANSEEQAKTSFEDVYNVIDNNNKLKRAFYYTKEQIVFKKTRSYLKYRTSNAKTKDGLRPATIIFDEIHEYENYDIINVFRSALGKKKHSRIFYITTDGYVRGGVLDDMLELAKGVLRGENPKSRMLPLLYHLDSKEEVHDFENWEKAVPSIKYFPTLRLQMEKEYYEMQHQNQLYTEFMTKRMNCPDGNKDKEVTSWENIIATNQEIVELNRQTCIAGIDYAKTTDFVAAGLLFLYNKKFYWITHSWVCRNSKDLPRIKAPLEEWDKQGHLTFVDDVEINPEIPANWLAEMGKKYNITTLWMDNYRYTLLAKALKNVGFDTDKKGKNNIRLCRPSNEMLIAPVIESAFANHNIVFGDNPLMRWYTNNSCMITSKSGNITYGKIEPKSRKTDGFKAFVAAMCGSGDLVDISEKKKINLNRFKTYTY